jgi:hypothetical protein
MHRPVEVTHRSFLVVSHTTKNMAQENGKLVGLLANIKLGWDKHSNLASQSVDRLETNTLAYFSNNI